MQLIVMQVDDVGGDSVQEVPACMAGQREAPHSQDCLLGLASRAARHASPVMADHHQGLFPSLQVLFQPQHSPQVQVVCGLRRRGQ
jgi:hypothetical protein